MPEKMKWTQMSVEEIEEQYGVKAKPGKITTVRGKYFLSVEGKKLELDPSVVISSVPLDKWTAGKTAAVRVIIGRGGYILIILDGTIRRVPILCYVPVPDFRRRITDQFRALAVNEMVEKGYISSGLGKDLEAGLKGAGR